MEDNPITTQQFSPAKEAAKMSNSQEPASNNGLNGNGHHQHEQVKEAGTNDDLEAPKEIIEEDTNEVLEAPKEVVEAATNEVVETHEREETKEVIEEAKESPDSPKEEYKEHEDEKMESSKSEEGVKKVDDLDLFDAMLSGKTETPKVTKPIVDSDDEMETSPAKTADKLDPDEEDKEEKEKNDIEEDDEQKEKTEIEDEDEQKEKEKGVVTIDDETPSKVEDPDFTQISDEEWFSNLPKEELEWYAELGPNKDRLGCSSVQCTSCFKQITNLTTYNVIRHPVLAVILCRQCRIFYNDGNWSRDSEGCDEYCRWCAQGGDLLLCDKCPNAFCKRCIMRNMGRKFMTNLQAAEEWKCLVCDPKQLYKLRATYHALSKILIRKAPPNPDKPKPEPKSAPKKPTRNFIDETISNAFDTLNVYHMALDDERKRWGKHRTKMEETPSIESSKMLRRIFSVTKRNMDLLDAALMESFKEKFPEMEDYEETLKVEENSALDQTLTPRQLGGTAKNGPKRKVQPPTPTATPTKKRDRSKSSAKSPAAKKKKPAPKPAAKPSPSTSRSRSKPVQNKVSNNLFGKKKPETKKRPPPKSRKTVDSDSSDMELEKKSEVTTPSLLKKPKMGPKSRVKR